MESLAVHFIAGQAASNHRHGYRIVMVRAARERRAEAKLRACRILAATVFLAEAGTAPHVAKRVKHMTKRLLI
jgi:hypothetical protein